MTAWIVLPSAFELEPEIETAIPVSSIVSVEYDWDDAKAHGSLIVLRDGASVRVDFTPSEIAEFCVTAENVPSRIIRCQRPTPHDVGCPCGACTGDREPSGIFTVPQEAAALVEQILKSARVPPAILGTKGMEVLPSSLWDAQKGRRVPMARTQTTKERAQRAKDIEVKLSGRAHVEPDEDVWMNPPPDAPKG